MRNGRRSVSEWPAALCSSSGATTQTSSDRLRATFSSTLSPVARSPSSLVTRMRDLARSSGALNIRHDGLEPAHVRPQRLWHLDRAVGPLAILHDGDQRPPDGQPGAVERVDEMRPLLTRLAEARVHAPRLEVATIRAR